MVIGSAIFEVNDYNHRGKICKSPHSPKLTLNCVTTADQPVQIDEDGDDDDKDGSHILLAYQIMTKI